MTVLAQAKRLNSRVLDRVTCPACGRPDVAVRTNFTIYEHQGFDGGCLPCFGSHPEVTLTHMLRVAGLDARTDAADPSFHVPRDEWHGRKTAFDMNVRSYYRELLP